MLDTIQRQFKSIGARLVVRSHDQLMGGYDFDIASDKRGEHFLLRYFSAPPDIQLLQADRERQHLLMLADKDRLLCGHDERHWFVAAVDRRVSTIEGAKRALLPEVLRGTHLSHAALNSRRNATFIRQGEWFFIPVPPEQAERLQDLTRLRNEPLVRGLGSKPHFVSEIVRIGGVPVMISGVREFSMLEWEKHLLSHPHARGRYMVKDPEVYARGFVRHPDHATILLRSWHRVYPNNEARSKNVSFYD